MRISAFELKNHSNLVQLIRNIVQKNKLKRLYPLHVSEICFYLYQQHYMIIFLTPRKMDDFIILKLISGQLFNYFKCNRSIFVIGMKPLNVMLIIKV